MRCLQNVWILIPFVHLVYLAGCSFMWSILSLHVYNTPAHHCNIQIIQR